MPSPIRISTNPTTEQVAVIIAAGPGSIVHHPFARGRRRKQLELNLGRAGVPNRLVRTLGWSTEGAPVDPRSQPLPDVDWNDVEAELREQGVDPGEELERSAAKIPGSTRSSAR